VQRLDEVEEADRRSARLRDGGGAAAGARRGLPRPTPEVFL
jgi:hypothetical protein